MLKKISVGCGVGLFSLLTVLPASAQEVATVVLRDGQRPSGELIDLNASGYALRVGGQDRMFSANDVVAVEFMGGAPPQAAISRVNAGQPVVVLRSGEVIDGRLSDISGTHPLRLTVDTPGGQREFTSNDVAQVYLGGPVGSSGVSQAMQETGGLAPAGAVTVPANQPFTNTGLSVRRNELISFSGSGDIMIAAGGSSGVGGSPAVTNPSIRYPVRNAPVGALIGRVGNGAPFLIGPNMQPIAMPANGQLFLGINDDHFEDNSGAYTVRITR
jgi:hypothetical protein